MGDRGGVGVRVQKQTVEGNNSHGGHGRVCEGDRARVGVRHGMVEVKLLCFRWLSPFLKLSDAREIPRRQHTTRNNHLLGNT